MSTGLKKGVCESMDHHPWKMMISLLIKAAISDLMCYWNNILPEFYQNLLALVFGLVWYKARHLHILHLLLIYINSHFKCPVLIEERMRKKVFNSGWYSFCKWLNIFGLFIYLFIFYEEVKLSPKEVFFFFLFFSFFNLLNVLSFSQRPALTDPF